MSLPEILGVLAGIGLLGAAFTWRWAARRRAATLLHHALRHPNPTVRLAAVRAVGSSGLAPHAQHLSRLSREEQDPEVLAALVQEISRNLWEPADTEALVKLRMWAHRQIEIEQAEQAARPSVDRRRRATDVDPGPAAPASTSAPAPAPRPPQPTVPPAAEPVVRGAGEPLAQPIVAPAAAAAEQPAAAPVEDPVQEPVAVPAAGPAPTQSGDGWHANRANSDQLLARAEAILGTRIRSLTLYRHDQGADERTQAAS